jgi:hypothetical protein
MYRHVALFRWTPDSTDEQRARVPVELRRLPAIIPEVRAYAVGPDAGGVEGHWDFAVVADFDDREGWAAYQAHPEHQRLIAEAIAPIRLERAFLQYEID